VELPGGDIVPVPTIAPEIFGLPADPMIMIVASQAHDDHPPPEVPYIHTGQESPAQPSSPADLPGRLYSSDPPTLRVGVAPTISPTNAHHQHDERAGQGPEGDYGGRAVDPRRSYDTPAARRTGPRRRLTPPESDPIAVRRAITPPTPSPPAWESGAAQSSAARRGTGARPRQHD